MRRAGSVVGVAQGVAVARAEEEPPDIGTELVDERLETVGEVVDVFGPVQRPYLAVAAESDQATSLVGVVVYARD